MTTNQHWQNLNKLAYILGYDLSHKKDFLYMLRTYKCHIKHNKARKLNFINI